VREALIEREVLLAAAPHIVWPMRFVLPHSPEQRPAWLIRLGLFLYDHLGGRERLAPTRSLDLRQAPEGRPIRPAFTRAFEYSDCWVDDARLVVLNALDAHERGAVVLTRTACVALRREGERWRAELEDASTGARRTVRAACVVNAAGPWVEQVLQIARGSRVRRVRLVKGSHIVAKKFWDGPQAYLLQNTDRRVIFVNPYEGNLCLIGTTDIAHDGRPEDAALEPAETDYLLGVVSRYFTAGPAPADVLHGFSGVRPLYDDAAENPSAVTRDYVLDLEPAKPDGRPALLSVLGGKITTYRKLAEHALEKLEPFLPEMGKAWTARAPLPGGHMPGADFDAFLAGFQARHPWLPEKLARHYARLYGTRADRLIAGASSARDLGRHFGGLLYEREVFFLAEHEWAETPEDVLERRTKHGLHLDAAERAAFEAWLADRQTSPASPALTA
jgi:D-erythritol 1-phosphate dehydrogenase